VHFSFLRFHTGDLGKLSADGFLSVTGRLKEQYKLENGNYVCPTPIEEAIDMSRFISQVVVTGDNRPYNIALVVPDWTAIRHELDPPFQANHGAYFTSLPSW
jgi:long-chain acyl-CoA synthetase